MNVNWTFRGSRRHFTRSIGNMTVACRDTWAWTVRTTSVHRTHLEKQPAQHVSWTSYGRNHLIWRNPQSTHSSSSSRSCSLTLQEMSSVYYTCLLTHGWLQGLRLKILHSVFISAAQIPICPCKLCPGFKLQDDPLQQQAAAVKWLLFQLQPPSNIFMQTISQILQPPTIK